jgi:hypothetical protein
MSGYVQCETLEMGSVIDKYVGFKVNVITAKIVQDGWQNYRIAGKQGSMWESKLKLPLK